MLKNQVGIVTGASRGIGKAIAYKLAEKGMKLALVGSSDDIHNVEAEMKEKGFDQVKGYQVDVSEEKSVDAMVSTVINGFGGVDVLVNNAGMGFFKLVEDTTVEEWRRVFDVNVQGVFLCSKAVLPHMKGKKAGTIITISSDVGRYTIANGSAYTATKYAVQGFSGSLAQEVREYGIRVGTVNPGMVDSYFNNSEQGVEDKKDWLKGEDIAEAVAYMASAPKHMLIDEIVVHPLVQNYPIA
ncbi:SDR family oxidoreductase [Sutcliffiella horikoshii]|uniref:SDR family oxidoreductase n=1 Tax=Sutcliffiella horikoshii TaxID=79883 RepID=UPI001F2CB73B|nr:SDR family oxidoreductase [Sutcliffiella horikoshii]MCG1022566.1 SDR family oxidoreductase [Sutcliffiella horikoshii]